MARFYDGRGNFVGWKRMPNLGRSLYQVLLRRCFKIYPELPWIPFDVIPRLEAALNSNSVVWEIGSGMSTLWLARRTAKVTSIEAAKQWFDLLTEAIKRRDITNVDLRFEWMADRMSSFDDIPDRSLDLLFIDGGPRQDCLFRGFQKVRRGGHIYLDNWDVAIFWPGAEEWLGSKQAEIETSETFTNFVPGNFAVNQGLLIKLKE